MTKLLFPEITGIIRKRSYELYNKLDPLFSEEIYENGLTLALQKEGLRVKTQSNFEVIYKNIVIGNLFTDIIVEDKVLIELKKEPTLQPINRAQIISYLKVTQKLLGLLINFGGMKFEIESFPNYFIKYNNENSRFQEKIKPKFKFDNLLYPDLSKKLLDVVYEVYFNLGPGFIHYIYRRAIWHELSLRNIGFDFLKKIEANYLNQYLGAKEVRLYIIENRILLVAIAVREIQEPYKQKLKKYLKHFGLKLGLIVNFNSAPLNYCFVTYNRDLDVRC